MTYAVERKKLSSAERSKTPCVSIVTPSFNQGQFIERTILSVLKQDYPNIQYIVLDALSTDQTAKILKAYGKHIDIVIQEKDEGQADALNKGFKLADGDYLAYLNSDDLLASASVVTDVVKRFAENKDADLLYGKRYYIDEHGYVQIAHRFQPFDRQLLYKACYLPQECAFWRREIYERAGGFIGKEFQFAMDYDLWLRMLEAGANFVAVDQLYGLFRWYENQKSTAAWESVGLPEIARLQGKYLGYAVDPMKMYATFEQHFSGVSKSTSYSGHRAHHEFWKLQTDLKRLVLNFAPMDHWVFVNEMQGGAKLRAG